MRRFLVRALVPTPAVGAGIAAFVATLARLNNPDTFWHLAVGRWISTHGALPDISSFYYSGTSGFGYDYSWLSQVLFFSAYQWLGGAGVAILNSLVAGFAFYLLYKLLEPESANALVNFSVLGLVLVTTAAYFTGRPAMFTVAFLAFELLLLSRFIHSRSRLVWLIPLLTVLWVNLHPGFILAPLIIPAFLPMCREARDRRTLAMCLAATSAAIMVNPYGWRMYLMPLETLRALPMLSGLSEWNRVSGWETVVWGILVALIACGLSLRRQPAPVVVLAAAAALAAGVSSRNMPLFGVITVFVLGRTLLPGAGRNPARPARDIKPNLLSQAAALARKFEMRPAGAGGWVWAVAAPLLAVAAVGLRAAPVNLELDLSRYPVAAVRFVEAGGYPGNLFVRETWSSYLLWTAPERRLFYDAKGGFSPEAVRAHSELVKPGPDWQAVADRYRVSTFLLERGSPLTVVLSEASDWHQVYSDSTAEVFVRRGTQPNSPGSASAHASLPTH